MRCTFIILIVLSLLLPIRAAGQAQAPYERVLLPIFITVPVPGAFGSLWTTDVIVRNESTSNVEITNGVFSCVLPEGCPGRPPLTTFVPEALVSNPNGGVMFYVGAPGAGKVTFASRVRDLSRADQTWGTSIPVVRERQVYRGKLQLLDVPIDARFRNALRVYDFDFPESRTVRLRIYDQRTDATLVDEVLHLDAPILLHSAYNEVPGSAVMTDLLTAFPQIAAASKVRIDLDPVSPDLRFWAFVSVTNDETQHVTTIVPQ